MMRKPAYTSLSLALTSAICLFVTREGSAGPPVADASAGAILEAADITITELETYPTEFWPEGSEYDTVSDELAIYSMRTLPDDDERRPEVTEVMEWRDHALAVADIDTEGSVSLQTTAGSITIVAVSASVLVVVVDPPEADPTSFQPFQYALEVMVNQGATEFQLIDSSAISCKCDKSTCTGATCDSYKCYKFKPCNTSGCGSCAYTAVTFGD